jgi:hypothetical protein
MWCNGVKWRFHIEHPDGIGPSISHFYWHYSWIGILAAVLLSVTLVVSHRMKRGALYDVTYHFGIWLLVVWFGVALVAMELAFMPWVDPNGLHY